MIVPSSMHYTLIKVKYQSSKYKKITEPKICACIQLHVTNFLYFTKKKFYPKKITKKLQKFTFSKIMSKLVVICIFQDLK